MASFSNLTPGIYWSSESSNPSSWEVLNEEVIKGEDNAINQAKYILIVTGVRNVNRRSFHVEIPKIKVGEERELTTFDSSKNYGTIYQWHFFLGYKNIINALTNRLNKASKLDVELGVTDIEYDHDFQGTIWTTTPYNNGGNNQDLAIQWTADLSYESARLQFKKDVAIGIEVITYDNELVDNGGEEIYTGSIVNQFAGAYYIKEETSMSKFYPLKMINDNGSANAKAIVISTRQVDIPSFYVYIQNAENIENVEWEATKPKLTKYQWQFFFAYSDLIDILYKDVNSNFNTPGELSIYGLPGMMWTSSDYICSPQTLGAAEISDGVGLKWVVCPAFRSSHIVLKTKSKYNLPNVKTKQVL